MSGHKVNFECCYKCEQRTVGCHSKCEDYLKLKKKNAEISEKVKENKGSAINQYITTKYANYSNSLYNGKRIAPNKMGEV